jgi:hypothetical protein
MYSLIKTTTGLSKVKKVAIQQAKNHMLFLKSYFGQRLVKKKSSEGTN